MAGEPFGSVFVDGDRRIAVVAGWLEAAGHGRPLAPSDKGFPVGWG
jgi:hypothetical protein